MKLLSFFSSASVLAVLISGGASAQAYIAIPGDAYQGNGITPDGEIVVGTGSNGAYY